MYETPEYSNALLMAADLNWQVLPALWATSWTSSAEWNETTASGSIAKRSSNESTSAAANRPDLET